MGSLCKPVSGKRERLDMGKCDKGRIGIQEVVNKETKPQDLFTGNAYNRVA